ncbi:MAG: VOC family protein [Candidatus Diapherotrites archaeon]|uniref:VOC family protein n=1 Tax=Candidatus Iainarchaeum sp. TaxID=3101447 RepID=A0A8T4LF94_9ARCH|nr:VOC family protein [Candidatus Diapherotrites archaeon]
MSRKISPCLWFDGQAEEASRFYVSVFPNSKITQIEKYVTETPSNKPVGSVMTVSFELDGNEFLALNGGPYFKFNEAISLMIPCKDQKEIDYYYAKLSADPNAEMCGWLKDKFGISWQLIPKDFDAWMKTADSEKKKNAMKALLDMKRINVMDLEKAAKGKRG